MPHHASEYFGLSNTLAPTSPTSVLGLPIETLASIVEQSMDCVKLIDQDGRLSYMNANGRCAMEIEDTRAVLGQPWLSLWPEEARDTITAAYAAASEGRSSRFDAFCPTAKGTPKWWNVSVSPIRDDNGIMSGYVAISRDVTDAELTRQALETTTAEMRHRLKNSYAMFGSLLSGFARGVPEREAFAHDMIERLAALGTAQTLFASRDHAPCEISELIPALVRAFDGPNCSVEIEALSATHVDQGQADAIALVLGELAVNSAKHGALGGGGSIVLCASEAENCLLIEWRERSKRPAT
ncbi:MAG: PAS domain S-box protein, partial [Burkholderiales bacterium]